MNNEKLTYQELSTKVLELEAKLVKTQWLHEKENAENTKQYVPFYGDVTNLNTERTILDLVGKENLKTLTSELMDLLDTSVAIYEKNGDYAYGLFNSGWCQILDASSRKLCNTTNNKTALNCGKWHCHEDCWNNSAKAAIISKKTTDINCIGGIKMFAEPIFVNNEIIGVVNIGYQNPPTDNKSLQELSKKFNIDFETLKQKAITYKPRPDFIIEIAKKRLKSIAKLIGEIVSRKKTEQALKESEEKYKRLVNNSSSLIIEVNADTFEIVSCNPAMAKTLNQKFENLIGKDIRKIMPPEIVQHRIKFGEKALQENKVQQFEDERNGKYFLNNFIPHRADNQRFIQTVTYDITEQKKAEQALKESIDREKELANIVRDATVAIAFGYPDGKLKNCNQAFSLLTGYSVFELQRINWSEVLTPPKWLLAEEKSLKQLTPTHNSVQYEKEYIRKDGRIVPIELTVTARFNSDGIIIHYIGFITDITDRKKTEKALKISESKFRELNATKDKFFSIISHDLRNPFNAILGFSNLALKKLKTQEYNKIHRHCKIINETTQQTLNLLNNLLQWSRLQTDNINFMPEEINLYDIIANTVNLLSANNKEKNIQLSVNIPQNLLVFADKFMLETSIRNLLSNAIKFTNENGWIKISAKEQINETLIEIEDNGIGISKKNIEKLFKFENNFSTTGTKDEKGTGLGLILCKEFIEKHNGKIWIDSEINKGTKFSFTLKTKS